MLSDPEKPRSDDQFVSIVMPALNEERYIRDAITSVLPDSGEIKCELLVMDGGSSDSTPEIVQAMSLHDNRIKLIHNPKKLQSAAVNLAAREADPRASCIVRADCHAQYPKAYAQTLAKTLRKEGVDSVVVGMKTRGNSCLQSGIAAAQNSLLGNGGSAHRTTGRSGLVDHGHHAAFDREMFLSLGGYDETCPYNEDAEFDRRLVKRGGRIYLNGAVSIDYFPRASLTSLARQYKNHGWGRANTFIKHGGWPKVRQVLPVLILLSCISSIGLAAVLATPMPLLVPIFYILACVLFGLALAVTNKSACSALAGPAAIVMHVSWATGLLQRVASHVGQCVRGSRSAPTVAALGPKETPKTQADADHAPVNAWRTS